MIRVTLNGGIDISVELGYDPQSKHNTVAVFESHHPVVRAVYQIVRPVRGVREGSILNSG